MDTLCKFVRIQVRGSARTLHIKLRIFHRADTTRPLGFPRVYIIMRTTRKLKLKCITMYTTTESHVLCNYICARIYPVTY